MKFSWWIVDAGDSKNEKLKDIEYTTGPQENIVHWPSDSAARLAHGQVQVRGLRKRPYREDD